MRRARRSRCEGALPFWGVAQRLFLGYSREVWRGVDSDFRTELAMNRPASPEASIPAPENRESWHVQFATGSEFTDAIRPRALGPLVSKITDHRHLCLRGDLQREFHDHFASSAAGRDLRRRWGDSTTDRSARL